MGVWAVIVAIVKAIVEAGKVVAEVKKVIDALNALSTGGLQALVRSIVVGEVVGAVAREVGLGGAEPTSDAAAGVLADDAKAAAAQVAEEVAPAFSAEGFTLNLDVLLDDIDRFLSALLRGRAVAGNPTPVRNATGAGDPVRLGTGEFEHEVVDLEMDGAGIDFRLVRTYRSRTVYLGPLGDSWDHSYNRWLREENAHVIARLTGRLAEQRFVRHPRFAEPDYAYYVPPDGIHDVIVSDGAGSFQVRSPDGGVEHYEATAQPGEHRLRRIETRFGSGLDFEFDGDGRLSRIRVNSQFRHVTFEYDETGRLAEVVDHTGRTISYDYDDFGQLVCARGPDLGPVQPPCIESYEYIVVGARRQLQAVVDWEGRIVVQSGYELNQLSEFSGWVVTQSTGGTDSSYAYQRLADPPAEASIAREVAVLYVEEMRGDGHILHHWLNSAGNELQTREDYVDGGQIRNAVTSYRYNADGEVMARVDAEGSMAQFLFGRDQVLEDVAFPEIDPAVGDLPLLLRMSFGNLLASVERGRRVDPRPDFLDPHAWGVHVPPVRVRDDDGDIIHKYTHHRELALLTSASDPRATESADPLHVESAPPGSPLHDPTDPQFLAHQRHLTRWEYGAAPRFEHVATRFPARSRPSPLDGVAALTGLAEHFHNFAPDGRPLERENANGYRFFDELYPASAIVAERAKEGYLRARLLPHREFELTVDTPELLEVEQVGTWTAGARAFRSSGSVADTLAIETEGDRIELSQSIDPEEVLAGNPQVGMSVDGTLLPNWDQSTAPTYVASALGLGPHRVELSDPAGAAYSVGRVRTYVRYEFDVDDLGRVVREVDGRGVETRHTLDGLGRAVRTERGAAPALDVVMRTHDPRGRVIDERREWRDEAGNQRPEGAVVKTRRYDASGNLVAESESAEAGGDSRITRYRYDVADRLREAQGPRGVRTAYRYDALSRRIREIHAVCTPISQTIVTAYDRAGNVVAARNGRGATRRHGLVLPGGAVVPGLDAHGRSVLRVDPLGHLTSVDYDRLGSVAVQRHFQRRAAGGFELISRRATELDEHGDAIRIDEALFDAPIPTADPIGAPDAEFAAAVAAGQVRASTTELHLDPYGQIVANRQPDGSIERERFDGQGRSIELVDRTGTQRIRVLDGGGNAIRLYRFEPVLDPATGAVSRQDVFVEEHQYDALGREVARTDAYGNLWEHMHDSLAGPVTTVDPLGNLVRYDHNVFGERVTTSRARTDTGVGGGGSLSPLVEAREYDRSGNLTALVDALGRRIEFDYDLLDRRVAMRFASDPGLPTERFSYDLADNLIRNAQRSGIVRTLEYDLSDRHVRTDVDDAGAAASDRLSPDSPRFRQFAYDAAGNVTAHEDDFCRVEVARDSQGHALTETVSILGIAGAPGPQTLRRTFDLAGRMVRFTFPSSREIEIERDDAGRIRALRNIVAPAGYVGRASNAAAFDVARFMYAGRRLIRADYGNGLRLLADYDGRGHLLERRLESAAATVQWRMQVLWDASGQARVESASDGVLGRTRRHFFDSVYRLIDYADVPAGFVDPLTLAPASTPVAPTAATGQATIDTAIGPLGLPAAPPAAFAYDDAGNRAHTEEPGLAPFDSLPDPLDRLVTVAGTPWTHDADGRLRLDGARRYNYDLTGSVQSVRDAGTGTELAAYFRDALGRVIAARTPAGPRFFAYDGERIAIEHVAGTVAEFLPGETENRILHVARGGEDYWAVYDGVGSLRVLTDSDGDLVAMPDYRPFGRVDGPALPASLLPAGFGAMLVFDGEPIYHSQVRSYRFDVGRHFQPDPAGIVDGPNLYAYARNNPVGVSDPSGRLALVDDALFWGIGRLVGWRSDTFLAGVAKNFVESWSLVLGTFNTFHGAKSFGDVMWGVLKLAHKLTLGLPQELAGIVAGYGAIELMGAETELWENVQFVKIRTTPFGAFTLGSKVVGDATSLAPGALLEAGITVRAHEQGHFYQNLVLGPLYIPVIGLPSLIHGAIHSDPQGSYGHFYTEGWANAWSSIGGVPTGKQIASGIGLGLGVAAAANVLGFLQYEASRRRDPERDHRLDAPLRLSAEPARAFSRPFFGPGFPTPA